MIFDIAYFSIYPRAFKVSTPAPLILSYPAHLWFSLVFRGAEKYKWLIGKYYKKNEPFKR